MSNIETASNNTIAQSRQAVATPSQAPGAWYNPLPNPYAYGLPTNGGNIYNNFGGMYPGGFQGASPYNYGAFPGGFNTAQLGGNVWGGYDFQNNNPNGPLPGYGYESVVGPTTFQAPLSGNGRAPLYSTESKDQELFVAQNGPLINMGTFSLGALLGGSIWSATAGKVIPGLKKGKFARLVGLSMAAVSGLSAFFLGAPKIKEMARPYYSGLDKNDNGHANDGSYGTHRNNDLNIFNLWRTGA
jgi:hypothetical protein